MASWLSRTTSLVVRSNRCLLTREPPLKVTRFSPPAVQYSITSLGQSISVGPVFRRMYCMKKETEIDEQQEKEKQVEAYLEKLREVYNTSQKILLVCEGDFSSACEIALALGDATNIIVTSKYSSADELKMMYEDVESQVFLLTKLGATIHFNLNSTDFVNDNRVNHTHYDRIVLML